MKIINLEVGRLLCRPLRDFLDGCRFSGLDIEYRESKGFLSREFQIKGNENDLKYIISFLKKGGFEI